MPGFNGRGPMGQGARSGRGFGYCQPQADVPYENVLSERGVGRGGRPYGGGRGFMRGGARGNGRIHRCWRPAFAAAPGHIPSEMERAWLADEAERLQQELQHVNQRLAGFETESKTE